MRRVLLRVLIRRVRSHLRRDVVADALSDSVGVVVQCPELLVECLEDVAQPIQLRLRLAQQYGCKNPGSFRAPMA